MNRNIILYISALLLASPACAQYQSEGLGSLSKEQGKALRDSLSRATEQLAYYPDSIDLRLKKAA